MHYSELLNLVFHENIPMNHEMQRLSLLTDVLHLSDRQTLFQVDM